MKPGSPIAAVAVVPLLPPLPLPSPPAAPKLPPAPPAPVSAAVVVGQLMSSAFAPSALPVEPASAVKPVATVIVSAAKITSGSLPVTWRPPMVHFSAETTHSSGMLASAPTCGCVESQCGWFVASPVSKVPVSVRSCVGGGWTHT